MYKGQYGFRKAHSTELTLMELIKGISNNLDTNLVTTGVFIYLMKAFDTIDHSILINKLCHCRVRCIASIIALITHYLINREQFVINDDICSDYGTMVCGIPQGSILGSYFIFLL